MVRLYEFYSDDWYFYIVTEYCEGGDLLTQLADKGFISVGRASSIMRQVLAAVEYCHKRNIVHRYRPPQTRSDLKPENVVFEGAGLESTLKIIDFGRSKILQPKKKFTERTGSVTRAQ